MQRIGLALLGLLAGTFGSTKAQEAAGTTLWRVAATTVPTPAALALGAAAAFWNPAQRPDSAHIVLAVDGIQSPSAVDASGLIATARFRAGNLGELGVIYGRVGLSDITQTIDSPDPTGAVVPVYTYAVAGTWSRRLGEAGAGAGAGATDVGATVAFHETRLDTQVSGRMTVDVGASHAFGGDKVRVAAATHFFSAFKADDPSQDIFAGLEARVWQGKVSGEPATVRGRYGIAFAHGFRADHQFGVGAELGKTFTFDFLLSYEGSYGNGSSWRPVAGIGLVIGKYRLTVARDAGVNDVGSAYRVGIAAGFK